MTDKKKESPWRIAAAGHDWRVIERIEDTELVWRTLPTRREAEEWLAEAVPEPKKKQQRN